LLSEKLGLRAIIVVVRLRLTGRRSGEGGGGEAAFAFHVGQGLGGIGRLGWQRRDRQREDALNKFFDAPALVARALETSLSVGRRERHGAGLVTGRTDKTLTEGLETAFRLCTERIILRERAGNSFSLLRHNGKFEMR
jgi:hypothetical protein